MSHNGGAARAFRALAAPFLTVLGLASCGMQEPEIALPMSRAPPSRPEPVAPPAPSRESAAVARHFADLQKDLLGRGLLRTDGGGADTPWGPRQLGENFVRIALFDEYVSTSGRLLAQETPSRLRRWQEPVRIGLRFGPSVSEEQRKRDQATVSAYAGRLARATGHPVRVSTQNPNFWVYVVSEDERPAMGNEWAALFSGLNPQDLTAATGMPLSTFCMVMAISDGDSPVYSGALAVIRAELPDLLRTSCFHEELAQGLGLANDFARARPSIFNDDEEFANLTPMDEMMLSMLYDQRLRPGMREQDVTPLLPALMAERLPGGS